MSKVLIGVDKSGSYRVYLTITTDMVEEARNIHMMTPLATAGLGRVLTATGLMSIMLKGQRDRMTVIFRGDGPAKQILASGYADGRIKGYISNPDVDLPLTKEGKLDVGGSLGIGELTVIKDLGLKDPYHGSIALVSGEIADDLTAYYFISEQQNTSIGLGVKINKDKSVLAAGGMFVQMIPGAEDEAITELEKMIEDMPPLTSIIEETMNNGSGKTEEGLLVDLMDRIFGSLSEEYKPEVLEYKDIVLECDCSEERMAQALMTIGKKDLEEIVREDGQAELSCHFCGSKYTFEKELLEEMLSKM
ncbi:MAG: Hsp33 family molecular chaperone HslO [Anaerovoracaceae bacterium]